MVRERFSYIECAVSHKALSRLGIASYKRPISLVRYSIVGSVASMYIVLRYPFCIFSGRVVIDIDPWRAGIFCYKVFLQNI
jgi:hypothetical protein